MVTRYFQLITVLVIAISAQCLAQPLKIHAVADEWAPFGGESLPNGGISLDVITTVLTRAGYQVEAEIVPWERALSGVRSGAYDVVGNLFPKQELKDFMVFSLPFYDTEVRFIKRTGAAATFSDIDSLRPYSIAVGEGYFYEESFDKANFLDKRSVTTVVQGVRMVAAGRVDLTLDSVDVLNHVIRQKAPELAGKVEYLPKALTSQAIHMGVRKSLPQGDKLVADFNRILTEMRADGTLDALLEKHR